MSEDPSLFSGTASLARRDLLQAGGMMLVGFSASALIPDAVTAATTKAPAARPPLSPEQLDSFIAMKPGGQFVAFFGKMDPGQGVDVAIAQIVAEELDLPAGAVTVVQGDTAQTLDQGGASASFGIEKAGMPLRYAAAEARRILIDRAAAKLGLPADALVTADGAVHASADPTKRVSYAQLIGDGYFHTPMQWNGVKGNLLLSRGKAEPKSPAQYKVVGQSVPRTDIRDNAFGRQKYVADVRPKGMMHARVIRPPVVGAEPVSIDQASIAAIPGVRVVHERGLLAVVAEKEWNAIRAANQLKVKWSDASQPLPDQAGLYDYLRTSPPTHRKEEVKKGDLPAAMGKAAKVIKADYEWPFQSHACMAPAAATADVRPEGATIWTGTQKPHATQEGVARLLNLTPDKVHAIWVRGPGSYGRNDAGDAGLEAAWLSRAVGRPVQLQYTREQGTGWDPKGPASVHRCEAAIDNKGNIVGYHVESRGFSRFDVFYSEADPRDTLPGQLLGLGNKPLPGFAVPEEVYDFPATLLAWETVAPLVANASPLRTGHLRDPMGPQVSFASECFIDEIAAAQGIDPVAFRLAHLDKRSGDTVRAAAKAFGWKSRPSGSVVDPKAAVVRGVGFAFAQRLATFCAVAVEIEVERATGVIRPIRWGVGHDCGLIVNPRNLELTIEGGIVQGTSRALHEEVHYDRDKVTSVDWESYPILDITEAPDRIDIIQINRPEIAPAGAGEAATRPVAAAIANALFDATGVRLRRAPLTPERVKAALA